MKVKIKNKIYDGKKERIMVILTAQDKKNIKRMRPEFTKYCEYPRDKYSENEMEEWMEE